jgi:Flp pilus assembly protein TadD
MTAAFAKELGLSVTYQSVAMDETWSRSDDIAFANGHVNVMLGPRIMDINRGYNGKPSLTIDFLPAEDILGQRTRPISEDTVVAMFMNNRSAEALVQGRIDDAYWWARAAVQRAPTFLAAFNTMGVIYLRHGDLGAAESVFKHVLKSRPQDAQALANLASLLDRSGRTDESRALHVRLSQIEPDPPYHFFRLGVVAMQRGDFAAARVLFKREVDRADYNGEFHFWLGVADLRLGDVDAARKQFAIALQNSTTRGDHDLYAAKLDRLRAYQTR